MSNYYPDDLRRIATYIEALDEADKKVGDGNGLVVAQGVRLTHNEDPSVDFGCLRDEIGGHWSWFPPEDKS